MDGEKKPAPGPEQEKLTAGQAFIRSIRPAGCVLFLVLGVLVTVMCFTVGRDPLHGYVPPEPASYADDLSRLAEVLEQQVFPALDDFTLTAAVTGDIVTVTVVDGNLAAARGAILQYFPAEYLTFERG